MPAAGLRRLDLHRWSQGSRNLQSALSAGCDRDREDVYRWDEAVVDHSGRQHGYPRELLEDALHSRESFYERYPDPLSLEELPARLPTPCRRRRIRLSGQRGGRGSDDIEV